MKKVYIGVLGLGTVGLAVVENLKKNSVVITAQSGLSIEVKKGCDIRKVKAPCPVTTDPLAVINDQDVTIVIETIGGVNPAKKLVLTALAAGKHVVTSNKELIALHLPELLTVAQKNNVALLFEGAVAGGIPILNTLRDNISANRIDEIYGIVNGTTNYILSQMTCEGRSFAEVLKEAQHLGFAEANPKTDIEGYDASYKAAILASVAFGTKVNWANIHREGIEKISSEDIEYTNEIGYVIKLLAVAKLNKNQLEVRVHPALIAKDHPLASVSKNFNAIYVKGFPIGELMFYGPGAGGAPTSSAVISDVINIAANRQTGGLAKPNNYKIRDIGEIESRYYIRLQAPDRHGVLAGIAKVFADKKVSIAAVTQKETKGNQATIVILIHSVIEKNLIAALKEIRSSSVVDSICNVVRIL